MESASLMFLIEGKFTDHMTIRVCTPEEVAEMVDLVYNQKFVADEEGHIKAIILASTLRHESLIWDESQLKAFETMVEKCDEFWHDWEETTETYSEMMAKYVPKTKITIKKRKIAHVAGDENTETG